MTVQSVEETMKTRNIYSLNENGSVTSTNSDIIPTNEFVSRHADVIQIRDI
mgnify:CR=1